MSARLIDEPTERALLGAVLLDPSVLPFAHPLEAEDFGVALHRRAWSAFLELDGKGEPIDPVTVARLVGDVPGVSALIDGAVRTANVGAYADTVRRLAAQRSIAVAAEQLAHDATAGRALEDLRRDAERLLERSSGTPDPGFVDLADGVIDTFERALERAKAGGGLPGMSTGLARLDWLTGGMSPGELWIIGGRPGTGKSALALCLAANVARRHGRVAFVSCEMPARQLHERLLAEAASVDLAAIRGGRLTEDERGRLAVAAASLAAVPLSIAHAPAITLGALRARARRFAARTRPALLVVDYLGLVRAERRIESRVQEIAEITGGLKALAGELDVALLALSQLNRQSEQRKDGAPLLSDLRDSGAIEQDADVVGLIHAPAATMAPDDPRRADLAGKVELIVAKCRQGQVGSVALHFNGAHQRFAEYAGARP